MTNIELVIKLDEHIAHGIIDGENDESKNIVRNFQAIIAAAIKNGTPLPKGHGRILDEKDILDIKHNDGGWYDLVDMPEYIAGVKAIIEADKSESEKGQPKQTDDSCLNFDFDKVKEILKKDDFDDLVVDHTCEEKQEQTSGRAFKKDIEPKEEK